MPEKSCKRIKHKDQPVHSSAGDTRPTRVLLNMDLAIWGGFCWTVPSEFYWQWASTETYWTPVAEQHRNAWSWCKNIKIPPDVETELFLFSWQQTRMLSHPWGVYVLCWDILTLRLHAIMPVEAVPPERRSSPGSGPPRSQRPSALTSANALHPAGERRRWRDREVICYRRENYRQAR